MATEIGERVGGVRRALQAVALPLLLGFALQAAPAHAAGFECPSRPVADEPAGIKDIKSLLPVGDPLDNPAQLNTAVATLRGQGLSEGLIIDNLIGAYCPVVAANTTLNDTQKAALVRRFASLITGIVFSLGSTEAVLLDVPLAPSVLSQVQAKAKAAGISPEDWIADTVAAALK